MEDELSGRLLVATPLLGDPNFRRTVVLVVEDEPEEGTLGVVLNRPTEVPVGQVLESWTDLVTGPSVVFRGGPVAPNSALALAIVPGDEEPVGWRALDGSAVMSRIGLVDLDAPPQLLAGGIASLRVFAGYAGWGPGQLQAEIDEGAWYVLSGSRPTRSRPSRSGSGRRCCGGRAATSRWWPTIPTTPRSIDPRAGHGDLQVSVQAPGRPFHRPGGTCGPVRLVPGPGRARRVQSWIVSTEVLPDSGTREDTGTTPDIRPGDGDHERFAHYVEKDKIVDSAVTGTPVIALCGKVWVPNRDPKRFPVCPDCKRIYESLPQGDDD